MTRLAVSVVFFYGYRLGTVILMVSVAESMMENLAALLHSVDGVSDDVDNGNLLCEGTSDTTERAELSGAEGGNEGTRTLDTGVAIGSICANKLVGSANPRKALGLYLVKQSKFVVLERGQRESPSSV